MVTGGTPVTGGARALPGWVVVSPISGSRSGRCSGLLGLPALGAGEAGAECGRIWPTVARDWTCPCRDAGVSWALPVAGARSEPPGAGARGEDRS
ncbi:hypothetical protein NDU88_003974 [Pleurodeles waltl]|uniref:Uncharacterized protein n=1 Tax=Pleurodeles waltl TaxID=8319 RepID=A0AAV7UE18_PLEWA|nr:hypothetical protein NDU88_003974 [Pleurodeles waltl]